MPRHQGALDGLCGPYAIANAFEQCGVEESELVFRLACLSAANRRWPNLLWEGTSFGDLRRMIRLCLDSPLNKTRLKVRYPFLAAQPANNRAFWARFNEAFDDSDAECAILGIEAPHQHWIVVTRHRGRLLFIDSAAGQPYELRDQNTLYAGERRRRASDWLVAKQEFALFHH
jgi:hypothetical protein